MLTMNNIKNKLSRNEETPAAMARVSKSVVSAFDGADTDRDIIQYHPISVKSFLKPISTAQRSCVKLSCGCFMVKSKAIRSTGSRFTPTEPNWIEEPAVINDGDIQHFSGKEPQAGCNCVFFL